MVAITLAAFATSSPKLTLSSVAALAGKPEIGLSDALGSNVVNIVLIFWRYGAGGITSENGQPLPDWAPLMALAALSKTTGWSNPLAAK